MITIPPQYSYLALSLTTFAIWLFFFAINPAGRPKQLLISLVFAPAGPISELLYIPDYWHPLVVWRVPIFHSYISIEDFLFAFSVLGIIYALTDLVTRRTRLEEPRPNKAIQLRSLTRIFGAFCILFGVSLIFWFLGVNSIYATSLAMLGVAVGILMHHGSTELIKISILGALAIAIMLFVVYWLAFSIVSDSEAILKSIWSLYGTSRGTRIFGVPTTELVWGLSFGSLFPLLFAKYPL